MVADKKSGEDLALGERCSQRAYAWAKQTFGTRAQGHGRPSARLEGSFSGLMQYGELRLAMASDGIGTKGELAERTGIYHTLGYDLVAMVVDDLAANGVEPTNLTNVLDVDTLDLEVVDALMSGLHAAALVANVAVVGGEIAELGERIRGYGERMHFNWSATGVGFVPTGHEPIDGAAVRAGDAIIALESAGFRANGFSLVRRVMEQQLGPAWHLERFQGELCWGRALLTRSRIYAPWMGLVREAGVEMHGVAHITGGGIADNLARVLRTSGLGARLDSLPPAHAVQVALQRLGDVPEETAYRMWNMGTGMLLMVAEREAEHVLATLAGAGCPAVRAGVVVAEPGIVLASRGAEPQTLRFMPRP